MKKLSILSLLLISVFSLIAQDDSFSDEEVAPEMKTEVRGHHQEGDLIINLGVGFPNTIDVVSEGISALIGNDNEIKASLQLTSSLSYGITDEISIGPSLGYFRVITPSLSSDGSGILCQLTNSCQNEDTYSYNYHVITPGLRIAYHRNITDKIDTYGTAHFGYNIIKESVEGSLPSVPGVINIAKISYLAAVGGRYYFSNNIAMYGEFGYGITIVNVGLTYRFN